MNGKTVAGVAVMAAVVLVGIGMAALYAGGPPPTPERPKPAPADRGGHERRAAVFAGGVPGAARAGRPDLRGAAARRWRSSRPPSSMSTSCASRQKLDDQDRRSRRPTCGCRSTWRRTGPRSRGRPSSSTTWCCASRTRPRTTWPTGSRPTCPTARSAGARGTSPTTPSSSSPSRPCAGPSACTGTTAAIEVTRVEIIELPAAGGRVRLAPAGQRRALRRPHGRRARAAARRRSARRPSPGARCATASTTRRIGWRDVIDFYARHSCEEYAFFGAYRFRTDPSSPLPARPME